MKIIKSKAELREAIRGLRAGGKTIGFVPTMGALHEGHLSLVKIAQTKADIVVASIFVNPAQFAPHEDFDKYPRQEESDLMKLECSGVDIAYLPCATEMYEKESTITISVGAIGKKLEGEARPHFFDGVALVVIKLFLQVEPNIAVFGEKDYQQLVVIKKLVHELDIPVEIIGASICREKDGLAMSSRNVYIAQDKRQVAVMLYKILELVKLKLIAGEDVAKVLLWGRNELLAAGFERVDYIEFCDARTLAPLKTWQQSARLLATARLGGVRLLDNIAV